VSSISTSLLGTYIIFLGEIICHSYKFKPQNTLSCVNRVLKECMQIILGQILVMVLLTCPLQNVTLSVGNSDAYCDINGLHAIK